MAVAGNLASSSTNVTGTASLAGTVVAKVTSATTKAYGILHSAGFGGTTFAALVVNNNPNFLHFLSYSATDVFLNLVYRSVDELRDDLDSWIKEYNTQRPHQGRWCFGKTPMQTFLDARPIA